MHGSSLRRGVRITHLLVGLRERIAGGGHGTHDGWSDVSEICECESRLAAERSGFNDVENERMSGQMEVAQGNSQEILRTSEAFSSSKWCILPRSGLRSASFRLCGL